MAQTRCAEQGSLAHSLKRTHFALRQSRTLSLERGICAGAHHTLREVEQPLKYASITAGCATLRAWKALHLRPCCNICGNPRCCQGFSRSSLAFWCWHGQASTIIVAAIFFGAYLLITGIAQVIFAFSLHVSAGGRVLLFISGAASLILAVLRFPPAFGEGYALLLLAIWIGVGFIFRGVATTVSAISDPGHCRAEAWEIFIGVISHDRRRRGDAGSPARLARGADALSWVSG